MKLQQLEVRYIRLGSIINGIVLRGIGILGLYLSFALDYVPISVPFVIIGVGIECLAIDIQRVMRI